MKGEHKTQSQSMMLLQVSHPVDCERGKPRPLTSDLPPSPLFFVSRPRFRNLFVCCCCFRKDVMEERVRQAKDIVVNFLEGRQASEGGPSLADAP